MFERALICTDLFDGLHRLVHCVPHLALSGLKQVIFLHSIP
ncbi:MAG: universal stress protein, partial [Microcystis aeruginosa]